MRDILDDELENEIQENPKKSNIKNKHIISYNLIMLIGGYLFFKNFIVAGSKASFIQLLIVSLLFQMICIVIGALISLILTLIKNKKKNGFFSKLFWFQSIEKGFILWSVLLLIVITDQIFS